MSTVTEVKVPNIGDFDAVDVIEVSVSQGDSVEAEQTLITLETDKAAMEVPSPYAGKIVDLKIKQGDKVSEGDIILTLETGEGAQVAAPEASEAMPAPAESEKAPEPAQETPSVEQQSAIIEVKVPDIGDFDAVDVIEVSVAQGDTIEAEDPLITLETDKAAMEVPSPYAGTIKSLNIKQGDKVSQGDVILTLETGQATQAPSAPVAQSAKSAPASATAQTSKTNVPATKSQSMTDAPATTGYAHAGPGVRRLAHQLGVDLSKVNGTGRKGRILSEDVHKHVKSVMLSSKGATTGTQGIGIEPMPEIDFSQWGDVDVQPLNRIKKLTAKNLHRNWVTIPHVTQFDEADITQLEAFREENKASAKEMGFSLTPLAFIMKAVVSSLQAFPQFNSSLAANGTDLVMKKYYHIGVAVDTPNGLVVPVVRDVDKKGLFSIAKELGTLSKKARDGKLSRDEMQGSCFSISSLGSIGGTFFTPIINAPDVAILGVSKSDMKPVYKNDTFVPRLILPVSLSYDHRVIDGAEAVRFTRHLCTQLEDIRKLLL